MMTLLATGWIELQMVDEHGGQAPVRVLVKTTERAGRVVITRIVVDADLLDNSTLRAIPVARIEAAMNHPQLGLPHMTLPGPLSEEQVRHLAEQGHLFPDEFEQLDDALDRFLAKAPDPGHGGRVSRRRRKQREPLVRPDGSDPERFYARVAEAYNDLIGETSAPAPLLAQEAGVPVPTVHRWIAEARRRGHLPPARKGRAG